MFHSFHVVCLFISVPAWTCFCLFQLSFCACPLALHMNPLTLLCALLLSATVPARQESRTAQRAAQQTGLSFAGQQLEAVDAVDCQPFVSGRNMPCQHMLVRTQLSSIIHPISDRADVL